MASLPRRCVSRCLFSGLPEAQLIYRAALHVPVCSAFMCQKHPSQFLLCCLMQAVRCAESYCMSVDALLQAGDKIACINANLASQPATASGGTSGYGAGDAGAGASASTGRACAEAGQQALAQQLRLIAAESMYGASGGPACNHWAVALQGQLEPAGQVAALVEAFYQQPEQRAAAALELAQAAATRSCANLRCPNVGSEGREAEGRLNRRCSACRAVRYCCRECSVMDWRAGHKRVCGALAAAVAAAQQS